MVDILKMFGKKVKPAIEIVKNEFPIKGKFKIPKKKITLAAKSSETSAIICPHCSGKVYIKERYSTVVCPGCKKSITNVKDLVKEVYRCTTFEVDQCYESKDNIVFILVNESKVKAVSAIDE